MITLAHLGGGRLWSGERAGQSRLHVRHLIERRACSWQRAETGKQSRIVVGPGKNDKADLWLEGNLAGILTLAAGKKTPARPEDEGCCYRRAQR